MNNILTDGRVAIIKSELAEYPTIAPYLPDEKYVEYPFEFRKESESKNYVYRSVRDALIFLGLDKTHFGTKKWNPLGEIIKPGDYVVIKPNFVSDTHRAGGELYSVITHPAVIRAICDYVIVALQGDGHIAIADAPQADTDFENLIRITGLKEVIDFYKERTEVKVEFLDLRQLVLTDYEDSTTRKLAERDPMGYSIIDLADKSEFESTGGLDKIYGADYDRSEIRKHHQKGKNEYCVANTILNADVIVNIPKIKTHRKAGVTLSMKNMVGINGNKNYLPHYRVGIPEDGGDEFQKLNKDEKRVLYSKRFLQDRLLAKKNHFADMTYAGIRKVYGFLNRRKREKNAEGLITAGNWYGNDTIWRTIIDLNRILIYAGRDGNLKRIPQRKYITFLDGIWAGEGEGPLMPELKKMGYCIVGFNPLLADLVAVKIMGLDYHKIPLLKHAMEEIGGEFCLSMQDESEIKLFSNLKEINDYKQLDMFKDQVKMPYGWRSVLNSE